MRRILRALGWMIGTVVLAMVGAAVGGIAAFTLRRLTHDTVISLGAWLIIGALGGVVMRVTGSLPRDHPRKETWKKIFGAYGAALCGAVAGGALGKAAGGPMEGLLIGALIGAVVGAVSPQFQ